MPNVDQNVLRVEMISMKFYRLISFLYLQTQIIITTIIIITIIYQSIFIIGFRQKGNWKLKESKFLLILTSFWPKTYTLHATMKPFHLVQNSSYHKPTDQRVFHTAPFLGPQVKGTQGYQQTLQKVRSAQGYHLVTKSKYWVNNHALL